MPETTLQVLTQAGNFDASIASFDPAIYAAINTSMTAQNANNASLRADINARATSPVVSAQLDPTIIQYKTVALTLVQILALNSAPVSLVAAQGAGTHIEVVTLTLELVFGSAAFANGGAVAAYLGTNASGVIATAAIASTVFTSFSASQLIRVVGAQAVAASSTVLNTALVLAAASADFITGTGATGIVKLAYRVHSGL